MLDRSVESRNRLYDLIGQDRSFAAVFRALESWGAALCPNISICLWLWDDDKHKLVRTVSLGKTSSYPSVMSADSELAILIREESDKKIKPSLVQSVIHPPGCSAYHYIAQPLAGSINLVFQAWPYDQAIDPSIVRAAILEFAEQALQFIEWARLESQTNVLSSLSLRANLSKTQDEFLNAAALIISDALAADGCSIFVVAPSQTHLMLGGTTGIMSTTSHQPLTSIQYEKREGATGWIWAENKTVRVWDINDENELRGVDPNGKFRIRTKSTEFKTQSIDDSRSFLGRPINYGPDQMTVGVIRLLKNPDSTPFLPYDLHLLDLICNILAPTIDRWKTTFALEYHARYQLSAWTIFQALCDAEYPEVQKLFDTIASECCRLFESYACSILLLEDDHVLRVRADVGKHRHVQRDIFVRLDQGLCGLAARRQGTVTVDDVQKDSRYYKILDEVRSEMCTPLLVSGRTLGVLNVDSDKVNFFRAGDATTITRFETFAKMAADTLYRANLLQEQQVLRQNLIRTTQMLTASSIASGIAHELKNGLLNLALLAQHLSADPSLKSKPENVQRLKDIKDESGKLNRLALELLDLSKIGEPLKELVYLNDVITNRLRLLEEVVRARHVKLDIHLDNELWKPAAGVGHRIFVDTRQIEQALTNLVLNAADASSRNMKIEITSKNVSDEWISFSVRDFGTGIRTEDKARIFQMFFTTKAHGFGVGLPVVKILIEQNHGGRVQVTTKANSGTTFEVFLLKFHE